jgi:hypothetical protein
MLRDALTGTTDPQPGVYAPHAYYRHLTLQKIMESSSEGGQAAMAFLREQDLANKRKTRDGLMLGGAICFVVGVALMIFLNVIVAQPVYLVGLFPLAVGIVLCGAGYVYRPAEH